MSRPNLYRVELVRFRREVAGDIAAERKILGFKIVSALAQVGLAEEHKIPEEAAKYRAQAQAFEACLRFTNIVAKALGRSEQAYPDEVDEGRSELRSDAPHIKDDQPPEEM